MQRSGEPGATAACSAREHAVDVVQRDGEDVRPARRQPQRLAELEPDARRGAAPRRARRRPPRRSRRARGARGRRASRAGASGATTRSAGSAAAPRVRRPPGCTRTASGSSTAANEPRAHARVEQQPAARGAARRSSSGRGRRRARPGGWCARVSRAPSGAATLKHTSPTGLSSVPPPGPGDAR